jgi:DNA-binding CsgD family transcriptional regulator
VGQLEVGRARELSLVAEALEGAEGGAGEILLISGEAGVGKTHLLAALAERAEALRFQFLLGRTVEETEQRAFAPFREAFGEEPFVRAPQGTLAVVDERARVFESVLGEFAQRAEHRGVVVAIDDLHWADAGSLLLFRHLARFTRELAVLLVGTLRDPDLEARGQRELDALLAELARAPNARRLALKPLLETEVGELASRLAGAEAPQALVRALVEETGGNALYVRELVRHLLEEGKFAPREGRLASDFAASELGLPPSLRDVVRRRAGRLSARGRALLDVAAVAAAPVDGATLARVAGLDADTATDALDECLHAGFVRQVGVRYELTHAVVARALGEEQDPERRARCHRALAEALGALADVEHAAVAAHYHASRSLPGAEAGVPAAVAAAGAARAAGAPERAATFLSLAVDLLDERSDELVGLLRRLAVARAEALDAEGAAQAGEQAVQRLESDRAAAAEVLLDVAAALENTGAPRRAFEPLVRRGLALCGADRTRTWARLSLLARPPVAVLDGPLGISRVAEAEPEAVALLRSGGSELDVAAAVEPYAVRSRAETNELVRLIGGWSEPAAVIRVLDACTRDTFFRFHDFRAAAERADELATVAERAGSITGRGAGLAILGCCRAVLGDLDGARAALEKAQGIARRLGTMHRMSSVGPLAVELTIGYLVGADWPALAARLLEIVSSPRAAEAPFGIVPLDLGLLATALAGDRDGAERLFPLQLRALAEIPPVVNEWGAARDCGVAAAFALGDRAAGERYRPFVEGSPEGAGCECFSSLELSAARLLALAGDLERASGRFALARAGFARTGRTPCVAICDHDEALALVRAGKADDPRVATLQNQALMRFESLGMTSWVAAAQALAPIRRALLEPVAETPTLPGGLTARELEVLALLAEGRGNEEIAARLFISVPTVERHVTHVYDKIGARGRAAATAYALRHGLLEE